MSRLLFLRLFLLLELVKDAGYFVGSLTLHKKGHKPKSIPGHCFVCFRKLKLMRFGLCKKDLFTYLLPCGQLHHWTEVAAIKVAEELHLMPHKLMHRHEHRLLGAVKPTN
jgi:hypothetical protein